MAVTVGVGVVVGDEVSVDVGMSVGNVTGVGVKVGIAVLAATRVTGVVLFNGEETSPLKVASGELLHATSNKTNSNRRSIRPIERVR